MDLNKIYCGSALDVLKTFPDESVQMCVTSPPYFGLRDYGVDGQIGLEKTPEEYVDKLVEVFREVKRVLRKDGTFWLNCGDSYNGSGKAGNNPEYQKKHTAFGKVLEGGYHGKPVHIKGLKPKDLIGVPWMLAFALRNDGWWLRSDIIWEKSNCMPESVTDRPTRSHEFIFLLAKSEKYYYDYEAIKEPCVWDINGDGTEQRRERQKPGNKSNPDELRAGIRKSDKQRGHSRRHAGFNDRWDLMTVKEQCSGMKNKRDVWTVAPAQFRDAHFATFPEALILPMILAGTSAKGCCSKCGAPYKRIVEKTKSFESGSGRSGNPINGKQDLGASETNSTPDIRMGPTISTKTVGWEPACKCDANVVPCIVCDPFMGAGTTAIVSIKNNRNYVGIELNPEYIKIAEKRIANVSGEAYLKEEKKQAEKLEFDI